jgi:hypothetical protein
MFIKVKNVFGKRFKKLKRFFFDFLLQVTKPKALDSRLLTPDYSPSSPQIRLLLHKIYVYAFCRVRY